MFIIWRGRGGLFETGRQMSSRWENFGRSWTRTGGGVLRLDNFHGRHMCIVP